MINTIDLSGIWQLELDKEKEGIHKKFYQKDLADTIPLPGTTSMAQKGEYSDKREIGFLTDPYLFEGYAWYSREITLTPEDLEEQKQILLYLERTRLTTVWVDDQEVGREDSLNTPHQYNLTPYIHNISFRLTILVSNVDYPTKGGHLTSPDTQTNWNGIIGEISLRICSAAAVSRIKAFPDIDQKLVRLELTTENYSGRAVTLPVTVSAFPMDFSTMLTASASIDTPAKDTMNIYGEPDPMQVSIVFPTGVGKTTVEYSLGENPILWSEYSPVIYQLETTIEETGERLNTTFGLRSFSADESQFLINGAPTFLRGKHDGLIFPLTGAVPTTVEEWIRIMKISKSYGINHYRFHTCCPPDAAFTAADLLGIYMEPQLPFWGTLTGPEDENHNAVEQDYLIQEGYRMMETFGNHASYCMMSLGNELWGNKDRMSQIIRDYKAVDTRHLYTQGSNNFQHTPVILPEDDFFVGVRFSKNRLFRGSYGMCDAPLGHIQWEEPSTRHNYNEMIHPTSDTTENNDAQEEIEIQYGTGVKKVKAAKGEGELIPHIPVVSHEIGQFAVYPNFREIEKYTGVLKARNFEVFRERLEEKGMLDQADDFFYTSGKLSVQCYKEELEAAARSSLIAGYQILDIQDFSGQGTALVGILDAFMDSKGHVTPQEWAGFCSDGILLAQFDKYVWSARENFQADMAIRYYNPASLAGRELHWSLDLDGQILAEGSLPILKDVPGLQALGSISAPLSQITQPSVCTLTLTVEGTAMKNTYELYIYPAEQPEPQLSAATIGEGENMAYLTGDFQQMTELLSQGKRVVYLPKELSEKIEGFYCTDFWCYPMFRDICEWMKKPVAVGTMGLLVQNRHPALKQFPSHKYSTPQWYQLITHSDCAILDQVTAKSYRPIVQMVDNFERNHKLGILFEGKVGSGRLLVCTSRLSEIADRPEVKQFAKSILDYAVSDEFDPQQELEPEKLKKIF